MSTAGQNKRVLRRWMPILSPVLLWLPSPACGWGEVGHAITGEIAERRLSDASRVPVASILQSTSIAEAAQYPDLMRSDPRPFWNAARSYHFVTVPSGEQYLPARAPLGGDAVTALRKFSAQVRDVDSSPEEKFVALAFIIHIIGDLHQPLHVGNGLDRGGNDYQVSVLGTGTNMHALWDSYLIDWGSVNVASADALNDAITVQQEHEWASTNPTVWISESLEIRAAVYPAGHAIDASYLREHLPTSERRLQQAGLRIAVYLDCLFKDACRLS